ncbi:MAG: hypothetical protein IT201_01235 [Thermoleophilia bacterium]|nr:hypothetical protein [Thermoleophilia bacterium]
MSRLFVVAGHTTETNVALVSAFGRLGVESALLRPEQARRHIRRGDVLLGRVDVLPSLEGVEACLWELRRLERYGVRVLNGVGALLASHDKLATALRLGRAGLPHPRTVHLDGGRPSPGLEPPLVLKPRFGSWGRDVVRCESRAAVERELDRLAHQRWFRRHGVLAQELVPPAGRDLRLIVAGGEVVGAIERRSAPGEWRTNVALGATRHPVTPPPDARAAAIAAAGAVGGDLVGVDLLPSRAGWVVLELNGAVDFTADYSLDGYNVFDAAARALTADRGAAALAS